MDINSINNNINSLNTSTSLQLDKTSSSSKIDKNEQEGLLLSINQYNQKRDELSLDVQSLNDGIAITKIAQTAIDKQKEFLSNIQDKLSNIDTYQNKNDIKQSINEDLRNFNQISYETKYKKEILLVQNQYDDKNTIDINTKTQNFSIQKPDNATVANEIFEVTNNFDLNNSDNLNAAVTKVESSINQLQNTYEQFTELGNAFESSALNSISEQQNLYNANQINKQTNFGKESIDFSKTNVTSNIGYLVASQANIVQDQSVKLLS